MAQRAPPVEGDEPLQELYNWVDEIPLSRPKRNISRDFADGVLFAEIVNHFFPRIIEMHNYSAANSHSQKMYNWNTLNTKVLKKLNYQIHDKDLDEVARAVPGMVERLLKQLQEKIAAAQERSAAGGAGAGAAGGGRSAAPASAAPRPPSIGAQARGGGAAVEGPGAGVGGHSAPSSDRPAVPAGSAAAQPPPVQRYVKEVDTELLLEKEQTIAELREMVGVMSEKIKKLEQLVRIKDQKIEAQAQKLQKHNIA